MKKHKPTSRTAGMSRRRFLKGIGGVVVALPFLESFATREAVGQSERPIYSIFLRQGNGVAQATRDEPERFWPRELGPLTRQSLERDSDRAIGELKDLASKLLVVKGCRYGFGSGNCGHSSGMAQCLTAAQHTAGRSNETMALGMSVDHRIASELTPDQPGLNLVAARISRAYIGANLSYDGPRSRRSAEANPYNLFLDLFAGGGENPEVVHRLGVQRNSVNDLVREELLELRRRDLSANDRRRLELHFDSIRDLETTMACQGLGPESIMDVERFNPSGEGRDPEGQSDRDLVVDLHMRLIASAFSCDLARTAVLQVGTGNDQTVYTVDGQQMPFNFHWISHRIQGDGSEGDPIADADVLHHRIDRKFARYFANMCALMGERQTVAGYNLLDDSATIWLNDLSTGVGHGRNNLPYVIAGSAGGALRQGVYVDAGGVTHNKFFNTILNAVGCKKPNGDPVDDFGDPGLDRGQIPEMMA